MSLPTPTSVGQQATVDGKTYQAISIDPPVWNGITTGTQSNRISVLEGGAALYLTLTETQTEAQATNLKIGQHVILTDREYSLWEVVATSGVTPNGRNIIDVGSGLSIVSQGVGSVVKASGFGFSTTGDNSAALVAMLTSEKPVFVDIVGVYESSGVSVNADTVELIGGDACVFKSTQSANSESFVIINTQTAAASVDLGFCIFDGNARVAKAVTIQNTTTGDRLVMNHTSMRAQQTSSTGIAAGTYVRGGFKTVRGNPEFYEVNSSGGSLVASGLRTEQNGSAVSEHIRISPVCKGIRPSNDGDGVALLQAYPFTVNAHYEVIGGTFENCIKRAIKTQCFRTTITDPIIRRTENTNATTGGNIDIDAQYGNCTITNPVFSYRNSDTVPANGLFSLNPQRGNTTDFAGVSTHVMGGKLTFDEEGSSFPTMANTSSFDGSDICDSPSVSGFTWDGTCDTVWECRPIASSTFNDVVVHNPVFKDLLGVVGTRFLRLDRSGTGYAFVGNANLVNVKNIGSTSVALDTLVTTNVGVTYNTLESNRGLVIDTQVDAIGSRQAVTVNQAAAYTFSMAQLGMAEVTAVYAAGSPLDNLVRKSILVTGNEDGEFDEDNIYNSEGSYGPVTMTATFSNGRFQVTITKPAGAATTSGRFHVLVNSMQGDTQA